MNKRFCVFWCVAFFPVIVAAQQQQCDVLAVQAPVQLREDTSSLEINSNSTEVIRDELATFNGDVTILSSSAQITANNASIDKLQQKLQAEGGIQYQDQQILVDSEDILFNFSSGELSLQETDYRMISFLGRGSAQKIQLNKDAGIELDDVSFTTCAAGQEDWQIKASEISLKPGRIWGEAWHTRFYLGPVPVLYLPYFTFPVTDQRQTGLLTPKFNSNDSFGFSYSQPFYWNIADNYDATFTPRFMTGRGMQLQTEFRYLTDKHQGQIDLEYLPSDPDFETDDARYFYRYQNISALSPNWQLGIDLNGLSDDNYIVDLGSEFYNRADTHLSRSAVLNYFGDNLNFSAALKDFQIIGAHPSTYRALPEFRLDYLNSLPYGFSFQINSELAQFDNSEDNAPQATRLHLAPSLNWDYWAPWGELRAESTLLQTNYYQKDAEQYGLQSHVSRTLGRGRLYGALTFERDSDWLNEGKQTLEPQIQYLYTGYKDQSMIGLYDTVRLQSDYIGLFRGQEYTGPDRISDTNQLTVGLTSRWLDKSNLERLRLSVAQIFYFTDSTVSNDTSRDKSALAAELDWRVTGRWFLNTGFQLDSHAQKINRSNITLEYRLSEQQLLQLSHRYVKELSGEKIDQFGVTASWPLAKNWFAVGRWFKDFERHRTIESYAGIQYESCCWAVQFVAERYLNNRFDALGQQSTNEFEAGISLKFVFKGMGSSGLRRALLNDGLFGYRQSYFLNN